MAPTYKLHYFNLTALGEPTRFLIAYGKANWEDIRYEMEEWPALKPSKFREAQTAESHRDAESKLFCFLQKCHLDRCQFWI